MQPLRAEPFPVANTPQQAAAWMLAERAIATLGELVAENEALGPVVTAAVTRVRKGSPG